jgi:ABC-type multidrug transport system fused ATPase/permease subunit
VLAYSYPLLGAFWTMLEFFLFIIWIIILFRVIVDIFRSHDLGGGGKALWLILVIILPFLGVLIYLIARGKEMGERDVQEAQARDQQYRSYVQQAAAGNGASAADQLSKLADLRDRGVISDSDFEQQKAKILG